MNTKKVFGIFFRYLLIIILGVNISYFSYIFLPLTAQIVTFLLKFISPVILTGNIIIFKNSLIELIPACIASSAYYLLFILLFSTPQINMGRRLKILAFTFITFFIVNVLRIFILILLKDSANFVFFHVLFWYAVSTLVVFLIWIYSIRTFKIKEYPFYSDLLFVYELSKDNKRKRYK